MTKKLDGKAVAAACLAQVKARVAAHQQPVTLAVIYDASDPASDLYVGMKARAAAKVGIGTRDFQVTPTMTQADVLAQVAAWNADSTVTGILVQSPLPAGIDDQTIFSAVAPEKDADGLGDVVQGRLFADSARDYTVAATPQGVMTLLAHYAIPLQGRSAVVVGRSQLFGRPMAALLTNADMTVTLAHRYTPQAVLDQQLAQADIVVVGVGKAGLIHGQQLKLGCTVIDVGINVVAGKTVGDVDAASLAGVAEWATPVPGGVGPMTIATLLANTVTLAEHQLAR